MQIRQRLSNAPDLVYRMLKHSFAISADTVFSLIEKQSNEAERLQAINAAYRSEPLFKKPGLPMATVSIPWQHSLATVNLNYLSRFPQTSAILESL